MISFLFLHVSKAPYKRSPPTFSLSFDEGVGMGECMVINAIAIVLQNCAELFCQSKKGGKGDMTD